MGNAVEAPADSLLASIVNEGEAMCDSGDGKPATHSLVLTPCNHSFLLCKEHTEDVTDQVVAIGEGRCSKCHAVTTIKSLEPI